MGARCHTGLVQAALALALLGQFAQADGRNPGSIVLFPEFDNTGGRLALLTITNTNPDVAADSVRVEVVFVNGSGPDASLCAETNATYLLSSNDTLTLLSTIANPNQQRGWAYAFAKDVHGRAISFDWLIGDDVLVDPVFTLDYAVNPLTFRAVPAQGQPTDLDGDGLRDLNGLEYEPAPARMLVPRFLGQSATYRSQLILINLTGGAQFTAIADFLVYNDNEEVFSAQTAFDCWVKRPLIAISGAFGAGFLANTNQNPAEVLGAVNVDTGWFRLRGRQAWSNATALPDPAILALLVERMPLDHAASDLPFETGSRINGDLLLHGALGDTTP